MVTADVKGLQTRLLAGFDRKSVDVLMIISANSLSMNRVVRPSLGSLTCRCINPKESEDLHLAKEVMELIPNLSTNPMCWELEKLV